jgi:site-specific DNA-methyltransferase (adenine-specific)
MKLLCGDALEQLRLLAENSVDAVVTDPPYGLEFMGKEWDRFRDTSEFGQHWNEGRDWKGVIRKRPGRLYLRSHHDTCQKCRKQKHQHDNAACPEPQYLRETHEPRQMRAFQRWATEWATEALRVAKPGAHLLAFGGTRTFHRLTCAIEDAGWEIRDCLMWVYGSGFPKSLDVSKAIDKAAGAERKVVGRTRKSVASMAPGEGNFSDDAYQWRPEFDRTSPATDAAKQWAGWGTALKPAWEPIILARKPLEGTVAENVQKWGTGALNIDGCRIEGERGSGVWGSSNTTCQDGRTFNASPDGEEYRSEQHLAGRWPANLLHDGSDEVVGMFLGAVRFFYCAKASKAERGPGNTHPTVKPIDLMRYLCRLVTPPGGTVLDPFMGSGSTGKACVLEGFGFIGIDNVPEYVEIARRRIEGTAPLFVEMGT